MSPKKLICIKYELLRPLKLITRPHFLNIFSWLQLVLLTLIDQNLTQKWKINKKSIFYHGTFEVGGSPGRWVRRPSAKRPSQDCLQWWAERKSVSGDLWRFGNSSYFSTPCTCSTVHFPAKRLCDNRAEKEAAAKEASQHWFTWCRGGRISLWTVSWGGLQQNRAKL